MIRWLALIEKVNGSGTCDAQARTLGELIARVMLRDVGDIATITRHVTKRGNKVYLDYLQNRHGQTNVAPFSVRPLPRATVSMPLHWDEVIDGMDPKDFSIRNAVERMERLGADPVAPVVTEMPELAGALERLARSSLNRKAEGGYSCRDRPATAVSAVGCHPTSSTDFRT